jgi:CDP-diacylglycerol--inositol 3-phosphatidyltransferase
MALPVVLYLPNVLGYIRIALAFYALHQAKTNPTLAIPLFIGSAFLDWFDGVLARRLQQTSSFGILLDIAADNILRTCGWMAVQGVLPAFLVCVEWITMLSTQLHAHQAQKHWKQQRENDPWIVRALFANNFQNPIGILSMYGLFSSYLWALAAQHPDLYQAIPLFAFFQYTAYLGRAVSLVVECWMIHSYLKMVIEKDSRKSD